MEANATKTSEISTNDIILVEKITNENNNIVTNPNYQAESTKLTVAILQTNPKPTTNNQTNQAIKKPKMQRLH
jgi:hypothetical protein